MKKKEKEKRASKGTFRVGGVSTLFHPLVASHSRSKDSKRPPRCPLVLNTHTLPQKPKKKKEVSMKSFSTQVANQIFNERINKNGVVISIRNTHLAFCSLGEKQLTCQNAAQWIADLCFLFLVYKFCLLLFAVKTGI